ncbi:pathogen-associated molecular patterns-induced protein A70 [Gastrolobium bilobum]|uniref:pathogen-associated molecular patterns-induced protein A70 n=1 Tax=Gastrolobium bilobum TaxID=150636 RepID=UPI002AB08ABE|nr:pathogen-associated molecular patterns-induced protein A70 [Gastrolobium bilobum]
MLEESVSSAPTFWSGLNSWFTPTVFFVVLQLVIGTIYITSTLANGTRKQHQQQQQQQHQHWEQQDPQGQGHDFPQQPLARSPSMLQRLKSINFFYHPYGSQDPHHPHEQEHQHQPQPQHQHQNPQLARSPSMLQRLKSINLYSYFPTEPFSSKLTTDTNVSNITHETHKPQKQHVYDDNAVVETEEEYEDDVVGQIEDNLNEHEEGSSLDEIYSQLQGQGGHFARALSDTKPAAGEVPVKLPRKMKKSASTKSAFSHFKEDDIVVESRRPATVKEAKVGGGGGGADDDGVDAKADDFINKFKQQLKLQRLDSIMRYKDMIGRGTGK